MFDLEAVLIAILRWTAHHWLISLVIIACTCLVMLLSRTLWNVVNDEERPVEHKPSVLFTIWTATNYLLPITCMVLFSLFILSFFFRNS